MLASGQPVLKLSVPEVLISVRSLYADELKPFGRVLLKRLRERAAAAAAIAHGLPVEAVDPETMPKIDPKRLRRMCQACPQLCVESEEGREFSVTLAGRPCGFLDVCSAHDPYRPELWVDVATYFQSLSSEEMYLPGGRYACARVLLWRGLPFLAGCSLGQVCHIVQLAISQKRLLGYREGQLVPYQYSEAWVKDQCAFHQRPTGSGSGAGSLPVATWEEARQRLRELLDSESSPELGTLTLSNVKRLFRTRFELELSETALGYTRLFDLLQDVRFRDVCTVQAHRNGQLLVKRAEGPRQLPCHQLAQFPQAGCFVAPAAAPQTAAPEVWNAVFMGSVTYPMMPMQIQSLPPSLSALRNVQVDMGMESLWHGMLPDASPRGASQDKVGFGLKRGDEESDQSTDLPHLRDLSGSSSEGGERPWRPSPLALQAEAIRAEEEESAMASFRSRTAVQFWPESPEHSECESVVKNTVIDIPSPTNLGAKRRLRSVPRNMGSQTMRESNI